MFISDKQFFRFSKKHKEISTKTINFSSLSKYNQDEPYVNIVKSQTKNQKKSRRLRKSKKSNSINNEFRVVSVNAASLKGKNITLRKSDFGFSAKYIWNPRNTLSENGSNQVSELR